MGIDAKGIIKTLRFGYVEG
ncbi:unnamed protein product, partial [Allacma fusca]